MNIKEATIEDIKNVANLAIKMWSYHTIEEMQIKFIDYMKNERNSIFIVRSNNQVIGFAQCGLRYDYVEGTSSSPVGYLEGIYVEEKYRKNGFARALLENCQKWAKRHGCTEFASDCEIDNADSLIFHLKMGFVEANRVICFTKKLSDTVTRESDL